MHFCPGLCGKKMGVWSRMTGMITVISMANVCMVMVVFLHVYFKLA